MTESVVGDGDVTDDLPPVRLDSVTESLKQRVTVTGTATSSPPSSSVTSYTLSSAHSTHSWKQMLLKRCKNQQAVFHHLDGFLKEIVLSFAIYFFANVYLISFHLNLKGCRACKIGIEWSCVAQFKADDVHT